MSESLHAVQTATEVRTGAERILGVGPSGELVGVATPAAAGADTSRRPGLVFINAGMIHRVGPSRLYVTLARELARRGFASLRFDLSGIGDSPHRSDGLPADESAVVETQDAMNSLSASGGQGRFILVGLCSGAVTAFRTALRDPRVTGAVLINPQGFHHDQAWNTYVMNRQQARRYVTKSLYSLDSWRRALTGRIDYRKLVDALRRRVVDTLKPASAVSHVASGLASELSSLTGRGVRVLVACSEGDPSMDYVGLIQRSAEADRSVKDNLVVRVFQATDHSFSVRSSRESLVELVGHWAEQGRES